MAAEMWLQQKHLAMRARGLYAGGTLEEGFCTVMTLEKRRSR
jgi:hypothetical protein